ncbi:MAG TPA: gamma-glutamyl-gamma-aminobutyrate hydrolase family protein [Acidobacteriota bacterium]
MREPKERPVVGIFCDEQEERWGNRGWRTRYSVHSTYVAAVRAARALPVLLPPLLEEIESYLRLADGLLLVGGRDIPPRYYGGGRADDSKLVSEARIEFELELARRAVERDLPLLGICLGCQVLNVALGGTLHEDLSLSGKRFQAHDGAGLSYPLTHPIRLELDSELAKRLGKEQIEVNSFHHQAALDPAAPLKVAARAEDGVIEAIEHPQRAFVLGVQWHPEESPEDEVTHALFGGLVEAARKRMI